MKRHIQTTGIRQWAGEDLLELQSEPLKAIDNFFAEYGSCVLRGCSLTDKGDGTFRIAPGLVALEGKDVDQEPVFMVVPFAGTDSTTLPAYLTLDHTVIRRTYVDDRLKPIAYDYQAVLSSVKPEDGICLELSEDHFPRFTDVIQDPEHRFFTDTEREMLNQHDADIERIDKKDAEQDGRLDDHDEEIRRIDRKDSEQDGRLDNHDQEIQRIDKKDDQQDSRLNQHDEEIQRIDKKDDQQDSRLNQHDADIERMDAKDTEQDDKLNDHDKNIERIDLKDTEQDNRLNDHDEDIKRIDKKYVEQDGRLNNHDEEIKQIDLKDAEQDNRLNNHDTAIGQINSKDQDQDGRLNDHDTEIEQINKDNDKQDNRLDDHDKDIERIDKKDAEQDGRLNNHAEEITQIDLKDAEQDTRLNNHDTTIGQIKTKDQEQDGRLTGHDTDIKNINEKDKQQDNRLDGLDQDIERIEKKDKEQDDRLTRHDQQFTEHTKGENKDSLNLYKVAVDSVGHIQTVEKVIKKDIIDLGIPAQDTTYTVATQTANGLMSSTDKTKLDKIADNANNYTHPTYTARAAGFNKVTVDGTGHVSGVTAVAKQDITTLGIPDTSVATTSANGLMSAADKTKLNGIAANANNYTHPAYTARTAGFNKMTVDATGHVSAVTGVTKADITALGIPGQDTTYGVATTSANGLMSSADKVRLNNAVVPTDVYKATSLANLPTNKYSIYREYTSNLILDAISFSGTPAEGFECIISIKNSSARMIVHSLPNGTDWVCTANSLEIAAGTIEEISIRYIGGKYLVRVSNPSTLLPLN